MTDSRVARGRRTQVLLAEWLRGHGFPKARHIEASLPGRDILDTPGYAFEVKATTVAALPAAMKQAKANAAGDIPVVLYRPNGYGPERMGDWLCIFTLRDATHLIEQGS